jgi:DNA adenine methylase
LSNAPQRYASPLRYPGGKAQMVNFIKILILENDLVGVEYCEPYAGGASVALSLLFEDYVSAIHVNDLNQAVHDFWYSILNATDAFCELIERTPLDITEWRRQREIVRSTYADPLSRGFAAFYLNRTNRSGIISGGVIGGLNQAGPWKIDARFPRSELVRRVRKVARFRTRITLTCRDTLELLCDDIDSPPSCRRFYFLDPPYYSKGERLYDNFYGHDDHQRIHDAVVAIKNPWIVSYDAASEIIGMYQTFDPTLYTLSYSANSRGRGSEVMFASRDLVIPDGSPAEVSPRQVNSVRLRSLILPMA